MAHSLNEHIEINELLKAMRGYQSLAIDLGID
jgi:acetylornithine deacetylase/succinyl-diaminopimelate desuccinylase-like protein